jgi:hypothetical protein
MQVARGLMVLIGLFLPEPLSLPLRLPPWFLAMPSTVVSIRAMQLVLAGPPSRVCLPAIIARHS